MIDDDSSIPNELEALPSNENLSVDEIVSEPRRSTRVSRAPLCQQNYVMNLINDTSTAYHIRNFISYDVISDDYR